MVLCSDFEAALQELAHKSQRFSDVVSAAGTNPRADYQVCFRVFLYDIDEVPEVLISRVGCDRMIKTRSLVAPVDILAGINALKIIHRLHALALARLPNPRACPMRAADL